VIPSYYAQSAVEAQNKINKACDEAGWLRAFTGAMWVFFFVRLVPFIGFIGLIGLAMTFFSTPVWLAYWWLRFGRIKTADVDYARAQRNCLIATALWLLMFAVFIVPIFLAWFFYVMATRH
jgi:hypothetical protein